MFETDYPHPTSIAPGPASPAEVPSEHIRHAFADVPPEVARKALHDNAAAVYQLDG
jgi:predicted TIM-barrel fold metal-dependent hydrolase